MEVVEEDFSEWDELKGNIIGKSNKDIKTIIDPNPKSVREDNTGNWKIITMSENIEIEEYALSYYKEYFKNDKELHWIINPNNKTTSSIQILGGRLYVSIREYIEKEENSAKTLGDGMYLAEYTIYPDGDIEKIE